ncbi:DUF6265 family protein [Urechidicola vernalis]|uniref:DUF6265 family protein n=1 Tax=Urechidicola vernalis TaxID=3075600 RepID=A0ABU2Y995_9FLAO|nr:DUF6265 family protein [Urechidicola sp. P050]MDT0553633.1 DUF6265 family protein [Urechidicola sp. P050]
MKVTRFISIFIFCSINMLAQNFSIHDFKGTWKYEHKETYEVWTKQNDSVLNGVSYKLQNGEKKISEKLKLQKIEDQIIYSAQVLNQNNAKWIDFELNNRVKDKLSFENTTHDFPNKIQYTLITKEKILVEVKDNNNQGFSFYLLKIKE